MLGNTDGARATIHEDYHEEDWGEPFDVNSETVDSESKSQDEKATLQEPISKLYRAPSFGSSKRSISEAELEEFDDGETTLNASPGNRVLLLLCALSHLII